MKKLFSNKENINILTRLLIDYGVKKAVICPGSRNSPIAHNLCLCDEIECYAVTDERSAGFVALGLGLRCGEAVAICVTSGSALLNLAPAIAEAYYRECALIVISADRPQEWIGQADGQTIDQINALDPHIRKFVNAIEPNNTDESWYVNRIINEALIIGLQKYRAPIHINLPLKEPLFEYTIKTLPAQRKINYYANTERISGILREFVSEPKSLIIVGQLSYPLASSVDKTLMSLRNKVVVLQEMLSSKTNLPECHFDEALSVLMEDDSYRPNRVLYLGGTIVSKRLKSYLRRVAPKQVVYVSESGEVCDTFTHLTDLLHIKIESALQILDGYSCNLNESTFYRLWKQALVKAKAFSNSYKPIYSHMLAVKTFHDILSREASNHILAYANSSAVRIGNIFSHAFIDVNRGVNGIEGSLSVAVGLSLTVDRLCNVYCVIGDLSFFYDQNALWNIQIRSNLRILLLNNGGGAIFHQLSGLEQSPYRDVYISGHHSTSAKGICAQYSIKYHSVSNEPELERGLKQLLEPSDSPVLVEVFTLPDTDAVAYTKYFTDFQKEYNS